MCRTYIRAIVNQQHTSSIKQPINKSSIRLAITTQSNQKSNGLLLAQGYNHFFILMILKLMWLNVTLMVRFWSSSRSQHVSRHLETLLLCQQAQPTYKPEMGLRESLGSRPEPTLAQRLPSRVHHSTGAAHSPRPQQSRILSYRYKGPFRSHSRLWHEDSSESATTPSLTVGQHDSCDSQILLRCQIIPMF